MAVRRQTSNGHDSERSNLLGRVSGGVLERMVQTDLYVAIEGFRASAQCAQVTPLDNALCG